MSLTLGEVEEVNPLQAARWREVMEHSIRIVGAEPDETNDGFLVLTLDEDDADQWGIYPVLSVSIGGTVAEYHVSIPYHYTTFKQLLTAAAARQSVT